FLPASWWESVILPARVADYRKSDLDLLCASGEWFWLGRKDEGAQEGKIAFFRMDRPDLYRPFLPKGGEAPLHPELYELLRERGAIFLTALAADTGEAPSSLTARLMDMVWQGLVANDQFAPLRLHGGKGEAAGKGKYRPGAGRWYTVADLAGTAGRRSRIGGGIESGIGGRGGVAERGAGGIGAATGSGAGSRAGGQAGDDGEARAVLAWTRHLMRVFGVLTRQGVQAHSPFAWDGHMEALPH